jgi:tRNA threonylcarbamoyladenosine modification (KEOPS) complex  Pcc1 subunit
LKIDTDSILGAESLKARAVVRLKFVSKKHLEVVVRALRPEVMKPTTVRSSESLEKEGSFLVLKIQAKDTVALRAASNAYLRWIGSVVNVLEVIETL